MTSRLTISPGSHSAQTSNGRQQTSQSVMNRWEETLVSMTSVDSWPQNGHETDSEIPMEECSQRWTEKQSVGPSSYGFGGVVFI